MARTRQGVFVLALAISAFAVEAAPDAPLPPALQELQKQGVHLVGPTLPAPKGMTGWAAYRGQRPIALYVTDSGQVIAGTLLDARGNDRTQEALKGAVASTMAQGVLRRLEQSHWIADGKSSAPQVVYVFTDPNCPYCNRFWADARPWVDAGKVQLRQIPVGVVAETSNAKAAALLAASDPAKAFEQHERSYLAANGSPGARGHDTAAGVKALTTIPDRVQRQLDENLELMSDLGVQGTPGIIWRDASGALQVLQGAPDSSSLPRMFGPR